jgi:hypothetical protein
VGTMATEQATRHPSREEAHAVSGPEGVASETQRRRRKHSEVRQRTEVVVFRLLPGERELLAAAAAERDISLSELIRSSVFKAIER